MKFVAASDFLNVSRLGLKAISGAPHKNHIPKGARFEIGEGENLKELSVQDQENIAHLYHAGRIVSEKNEDAVKLIDAEVKTEADRLAKLEKASKAPAEVKK